MKKFKKISLGLGLAIILTGLFWGYKAYAANFNVGQVSFAFKSGDPTTIEATIGGTKYDFTNSGMTNQQLQTMGERNVFPPSIGYSYSGSALCSPFSAQSYGLPAGANLPPGTPNKPQLNVSFSNYSTKSIDASIQAFMGSGNSSTNCQVVTDSGSALNGFKKSANYTFKAPITGQGSQFRDSSFKGATFKFTAADTIEGTLPNNGGGSTTIKFTDGKPIDFKPGFTTDNSYFCGSNEGSASFSSTDQGNDPITINVTLYYYTSSGVCTPTKGLTFRAGNPNKLAEKVVTWNDTEIDSVGSDGTKFNPQQTTNGPSKTVYVSDSGCSGYGINLADDNSGTIYKLNGSGSSSGPFSNCSVDKRAVLVAGTRNQADPTAGNGTTNQETDCETHAFGFAFAWAVCPVLDVANALTTSLENLFEDQLSFSVSQLGNCSSNTPTDGCFKVQKSWALMRDIAASLLVIVMLIMVFSQAASFGPFDAYTVKKLLPRLVAAVILMQISWYLFAWVIDLVNDVARGIADIMYYPFGGPNQMDLWHLLSNAKLSDGLLGAMNWGAIAVFAFLGYAFVFTMLGFAFTAIIALFFAVITLVFRKVLLILLLILSPIAVLAWVLPGTERYWKMWRDNFFKALAMFPIAVAIIAAGRIFCSIVGTQDNTQFLNLIFIMVGYFGPLFILPKTFKWGGQAMQMAGENINKVGNKLGERQKKFWDNRQEGWSTERKRRSQERVSGHKQYKGLSQVWNRPLDKVLSGQWDPTLGPRGSRRRFEAVTGYEAAGRESSGKTAETAKAAAQQLFDNAQDHDEVARMLMRGQPFDYIDKRGKKRHYKPPVGAGAPYMIAAGAAGIAKYGTDGSMRVFQAEIDRMRAAGGDQALLAEQILDDNVEKMKPRMDSMYRGFDRGAYQEYLAAHPGDEQGAIRAGRARSIKSSIESMKENWFDGMEGVEAQSLLAGLSHGIASGDPESEQRMEKLWQDYKKACANPNIHLAPGVHKAFKAYADGNHGSSSNGSIEDINAARTGTDPNAPVMGEGVSRVKGDRTDDNGVVIERVDRRVQVRDKPVLDDIVRDDPRNQAVIASIGAGEFADHFDGDGSPTRPISHEDIVPGGGGGGGGGSGSAPEVVISPGQLVIQHRDVIAPRVLPPVATLDPASVGAQATANREAFKIQLQTNPEVVQTLATSIANGIAAPEHQAVLGEMRTAAENVLRDPRATDQQKAEARSSWNKVASQIQQAYLQKTEAIVAHAVQSGTDPAAARTAAMSAIDTATRRTAAEDVQALQPGGASPLSQL